MLVNVTGIDGCGKSTQVDLLRGFLESRGRRVFVSKAYGPDEKRLFGPHIPEIGDTALMFLFQAFHAEQQRRASEALARREIVLADRWDEGYEAYHSLHGPLSEDRALREAINHLAFEGLVPDVTFLLNVAPQTGMVRSQKRGADFFDARDLAYHAKLAASLRKIARERNWMVLDGEASIAHIHELITTRVARLPHS